MKYHNARAFQDSPDSSNDNNNNRNDLLEPLISPSQQQNDSNVVVEKDVIIPKWVTFWRSSSLANARLNHNVFLNLVLYVLYGIGYSLWTGTVVVAYLKRLGHNHNGPVGDIEAVNGMAVLFSALPVGYLADRIGRSRVISAGGVLYIVTSVVHVALLLWIGVDETNLSYSKSQTALVLLAITMALWGIGSGVVSGPAQALYADSTPEGQRSTYFAYQFAAYILASAIGPILSIVLFQSLGDDWDLYHLRAVMFVGIGLSGANAVLMFFFDDAKALDEPEEEQEEKTNDHGPTEKEGQGGHNDETSDEAVAAARDETDPETDAAAANDDEEVGPSFSGVNEEASSRLVERRKWIPYILFCGGLTVALSSGMTVKFFPLFFKDDVGLSPTQVQTIYAILPFVMVPITGLVTKASAVMGRVQVTILSMLLGAACLYSMVFLKSFLDSRPFVLVPVYLMRTSLVNSSYPIRESILMDFCPKNQRARWKSLQSISTFGWCGSAALGGYLSDRWDYTFTFFITATIQVGACLIYAFLIPLVPRKEGER